eukprot:m.142976 g.142976  ORF g.142976 m.142976 type:complete len:914 (+) comp38371_c0_seq1:46-2787(+)
MEKREGNTSREEQNYESHDNEISIQQSQGTVTIINKKPRNAPVNATSAWSTAALWLPVFLLLLLVLIMSLLLVCVHFSLNTAGNKNIETTFANSQKAENVIYNCSVRETSWPLVFIPVSGSSVDVQHRARDLEKMSAYFREIAKSTEGCHKVRALFLTGISGSGKTTLANSYLELFEKRQQKFKAVVTLKASDISSLEDSMLRLFTRANYTCRREGECGQWKYQRLYLPELLTQLSPWLLLLDDFDGNSDIGNFFPFPGETQSGNGSLIVTVEKGYPVAVSHYCSRVMDVNTGMSREDAIALMNRVSKDQSGDPNEMYAVALDCDFLPLSLAALSLYHSQKRRINRNWTWKDSHFKFQQQADEPETAPSRTLFHLNSLNWEKDNRKALKLLLEETLTARSPISSLLRLFGLLNDTRISTLVIQNFLKESADDALLDAELFTLRRVVVSDDVVFITIHKITRKVLRQLTNLREENEMRQLADAIVATYHEYHEQERTKPGMVLMNSLESHAEVLLKSQGLRDFMDAGRLVWLYSALAHAKHLVGSLSSAFSLFEKVILQINETDKLVDFPAADKIRIITRAAACASELGMRVRAGELFQSILEIVNSKLESSFQLIRAKAFFRYHYGCYLKLHGKYSQGLSQFSLSFGSARYKHQDEGNNIMWDDVMQICSTLKNLGKGAASRSVECHKQAVDRLSRTPDAANWHIAKLNTSMVLVQHLFLTKPPKCSKESDERLEWAYRTFSELYGKEDRNVADVQVARALVDLSHGRYHEAIKKLNFSQTIYEKSQDSQWRTWHGFSHFFKGYCLLQSAENTSLNSLKQVERHFQRAYSIAVHNSEHKHRDLSCAMSGLAKVYLLQAQMTSEFHFKAMFARKALLMTYYARQPPCPKQWYSLYRIRIKSASLLFVIEDQFLE